MKNIRALLVDDEKELMTAMVERLEYRNVEAEFALSGYEALEKLKIGGFNVIVVDLKMPGMSGADLIKAIRRDYSDLPILLMTGHGFTINGEDIPEGVADFLPKPLKIEELVSKLFEVVKDDE